MLLFRYAISRPRSFKNDKENENLLIRTRRGPHIRESLGSHVVVLKDGMRPGVSHRRKGCNARGRAVGLANGRNPIAILVPCHRVIGADGSLTGYGGGLERKQWLLAHEGLH
jgi:O-6-methylguanine DNA methyltransferase